MPRNLSIIPARKTRTDLRLPLPDARPVLNPIWPGPAFWQAVLDDPDWWWIYNLPPVPKHGLRDARRLHLIVGVAIRIEDHSRCPFPRPKFCDPFAPQNYHARQHSRLCLAYRDPSRMPQHPETRAETPA